MDLSVSCSGPSILSSMPEIDDSHFDSDLFAIIAEVEQHVVLRTQFERQVNTNRHICSNAFSVDADLYAREGLL